MLEQPETDIPHRGKVMPLGQSAGKSFAYLLGVFLGDGCVTLTSRRKPMFRLNTIDKDFAEATQRALLELTDRTANYTVVNVKGGNPQYQLRCTDPAICACLEIDTQSKRVIPNYVFSWDDERKKAFVVGLMDSEGYVAENKHRNVGPVGRQHFMGFKCCDPWIHDFSRLLQQVGVKLGKVTLCKPNKPHHKPPTRMYIQMQSWADSGMRFNIARKQQRVERWAAIIPYLHRNPRGPRKLTSETSRQAARCG